MASDMIMLCRSKDVVLEEVEVRGRLAEFKVREAAEAERL